ncbi:MAG: hypothetical protein WCC06_03980 [Candidatus Aminicenantales bacterium]
MPEDDDLPYGAVAVLDCYRGLEGGTVLVICERTFPKSSVQVELPRLRTIISALFTWLIQMILPRMENRDTQCGLKEFTSEFVHYVLYFSRIDRFAFGLDLILIIQENRLPLMRIPVRMTKAPFVSKRVLVKRY